MRNNIYTGSLKIGRAIYNRELTPLLLTSIKNLPSSTRKLFGTAALTCSATAAPKKA
jgi:hypothetical protein